MVDSKPTQEERISLKDKFVSQDWWKEECLRYRSKVLTGNHAHICDDWDGLPVDETVDEYSCCTCDKSELPNV